MILLVLIFFKSHQEKCVELMIVVRPAISTLKMGLVYL